MAFRLCNLPQEIQDNVYQKFYEDAILTVTFHYNNTKVRTSSKDGVTYIDRLSFPTLPSMNLDLVSQKVCSDARRARNARLDRNLAFKGLGWEVEDIEALLNKERYGWLHAHVKSVQFDHFIRLSEDHWQRFLSAFSQVRAFDVALRFVSYGRVDLRQIVSPTVAEEEAGRLTRLGVVLIAKAAAKIYNEEYAIKGRTMCTWRGWTHDDYTTCEFVYDVRADGCRPMWMMTLTPSEGKKVIPYEKRELEQTITDTQIFV